MQESMIFQWENEKLIGTFDYPKDFNPVLKYPLIIICHGFISNRIGMNRLFVKTAEQLIRENFVVLRFDYAGCGESTGNYGETGLCDLVSQTEKIIDIVIKLEHIDKEKIILLGHSLGGATAVLTAAKNRQVKDIVIWAAVQQPFEDIANIVGKKEVQSLTVDNSIDHMGYYFKKSFFDSLKKHNVLAEIHKINGDVLVIHGTNDDDIPVRYCGEYEKQFLKRKNRLCSRHEIQGADHLFANGEHFSELIETTKEWLLNQLGENQWLENKIS